MSWPLRYKIVGLLMLGIAINFIDRVNIAIAAPDIMLQTGWDKASFGVVMSAYLLGYASFQFPGGLLADRWSAQKMLGFSCLGFSLFTALTPLGIYFGFASVLAIRVMVGMFESISLPALTAFNAAWVPRQEFGRAQTVGLCGTYFGQVIAYPMTTGIIELSSWPFAFYFNAILGFLWMAIWFQITTNKPSEHPKISKSELTYIEEHAKQQTPFTQRPAMIKSIMTTPLILPLCASYMTFAFVGWIFIFWFPTYLVEARGFSRLMMGSIGMLPTIGALLGNLFGGVISDSLLRRGFSAVTARTRFPALCFGLSMLLLIAAVRVPWASISVGLLVFCYFAFSSATVGYWTMPLEIAPRAAGAVSGLMLTSGTIVSILAPMIAGYVLTRTGSWTTLFTMVSACGLVGALVFLLWVVPRPTLPRELAVEG